MKTLLFLTVIISAVSALAGRVTSGTIYQGASTQPVTLAEVAATVEPGTIVIVSEIHNFQPHHENQIKMINALGERGLQVSVGMEFFSWPNQDAVDAFLKGQMDEPTFLKAVGWGGNSFDPYRYQVLYPMNHGGTTIALNSPRMLNAKVARKGLGSLTPEDWALMPPQFELGRSEYFERFKEVMSEGGHLPSPEALNNYFAAQSIWDDSMSWKAIEYMNAHPEQVLVVIVGDFHNAYYGGLPNRIQAKGFHKVITVSQVNMTDLTDDEVYGLVAPHPRWGQRADYVWANVQE